MGKLKKLKVAALMLLLNLFFMQSANGSDIFVRFDELKRRQEEQNGAAVTGMVQMNGITYQGMILPGGQAVFIPMSANELRVIGTMSPFEKSTRQWILTAFLNVMSPRSGELQTVIGEDGKIIPMQDLNRIKIFGRLPPLLLIPLFQALDRRILNAKAALGSIHEVAIEGAMNLGVLNSVLAKIPGVDRVNEVGFQFGVDVSSNSPKLFLRLVHVQDVPGEFGAQLMGFGIRGGVRLAFAPEAKVYGQELTSTKNTSGINDSLAASIICTQNADGKLMSTHIGVQMSVQSYALLSGAPSPMSVKKESRFAQQLLKVTLDRNGVQLHRFKGEVRAAIDRIKSQAQDIARIARAAPSEIKRALAIETPASLRAPAHAPIHACSI